MSISIEICLLAAAILLGFDILLVCRLIINKLKNEQVQDENKQQKALIVKLLSGLILEYKNKVPIADYFDMKQSFSFDKLGHENIKQSLNIKDYESKNIKRLKSAFRVRRMEAAVQLGLLASRNGRLALEKTLLQEKDYSVKLYMANALSDIADPESIPILVASLINSNHWYRDKVNMLISDFGEAFNLYLLQIMRSPKIEIKELIVNFASVYFSRDLPSYLINLIDNSEAGINELQVVLGQSGVASCANCMHGTTVTNDGARLCRFKGTVRPDYYCKSYQLLPVSINAAENYIGLVYKAADVLRGFYPHILNDNKYLNSADIKLQNIAITALANFRTVESINKLLAYLKSDTTARSAVHAISEIIEKKPEYINTVVDLFHVEPDIKIKTRLAEILAGKIEYFIMKLSSKNRNLVAEIIKQILLLNKSSEVIDFLNKNRDIDLENELADIIREVVPLSIALETEFCSYLNDRLLYKCGLTRCELILSKGQEKKDVKLIKLLYSLMIALFMLFPAIYCARHYDILFNLAPLQQMRIFVVDFNYYLAYYSIAINLIYLGLLVLSYFKVKQQYRLWKIKKTSLLFKNKILPSISIIAPAFNEEKTIIESANSLLNLKYPDYELIIVNDGSQDNTLNVLIKYFDLTRVDYIFDYRLNTRAVRGVYMNHSLPKLIVVDKENGGKADSLNAGINISSKEYFCGIDADSLLEDDALLKLASLTLDEGIETPALGGNIFPINGCTIERGQIKNINIPDNKLARFQTIEYIRAFMAGRLGWAALNSLLIISGAFGLFRKERVISIGGYLTSSGKYARDTVGEDMELVVRISRMMRELNNRYRICYAFNANCWTEVPEDLISLKKQRYRWHRGLIDILTFHKQMLFNPRYGRTGLFALPYFFIFEMIGPIIEIQGYLMVLVAFLLGLLNAEIALLLLISTVFMGVLISIASLLIAEKDTKYFRVKDILILILYAIIENFGPRQLFSFWRVGGYLNMLKKPTGWGKAERKGFAVINTSVEV
jgi:cellulose synthase/poly-beta-1,6-N-acetylglucosamine synthase-like glycosyltransferase